MLLRSGERTRRRIDTVALLFGTHGDSRADDQSDLSERFNPPHTIALYWINFTSLVCTLVAA